MSEPNVLSGEVARVAQVWSAPDLDRSPAQPKVSARVANQIQTLGERAFEQAQNDGFQAGIAAAQPRIDAKLRELDERIRQFESALGFLARPMAQLTSQVQDQLAELAIAIARHVLRRELRMDPTQIIAVVRETVALLPASARQIRVQLHPEDAAILRERLTAAQVESAWTLAEDPMMTRGGCRVTADAAQIDARVETRIAAVCNALLGEERSAERADMDGGTMP